MADHRRTTLLAAFLVVTIGVLVFRPVSVVKGLFSYQFEPDANYSQNAQKVVLRIYPGTNQSDNPARVDWLDPSGTKVSYCTTGACGTSFDQLVADNGALTWRAFYFYINGQSRENGTYTAVAYRYEGVGVYSEIFRATFTLNGTSIPPTPTPAPHYIGKPDPTFGNNGIVKTQFTNMDGYGYDVAVQPDGKSVTVVIDSSFPDLMLVRHNVDGSLDTTFGVNGLAMAPVTDFGYAFSLALQQDGKMVVVGFSNPLDTRFDFAVARFNLDGSLDAGFNGGSPATTDFGGSDMAYGVAVQPDGKILVAGETYSYTTEAYRFALARYNDDGSLDTSFGTGGKVTTDFIDNSFGRAVAIQGDGKIVVAGSTYNSSADRNSFALARYNADGSLDTGFGENGLRTSNFFKNASGKAVAVQPDGKILVAGTSFYSGSGTYWRDFTVARYTSDGYLDMGFGVGGAAEADLGGEDSAYDMVLQPDGKILLGGMKQDSGYIRKFGLARFTIDGSLDIGSGTNGMLVGEFGEGYALAVQPDGKIVMVGSETVNILLARYVLKTDLQYLFLPMITTH